MAVVALGEHTCVKVPKVCRPNQCGQHKHCIITTFSRWGLLERFAAEGLLERCTFCSHRFSHHFLYFWQHLSPHLSPQGKAADALQASSLEDRDYFMFMSSAYKMALDSVRKRDLSVRDIDDTMPEAQCHQPILTATPRTAPQKALHRPTQNCWWPYVPPYAKNDCLATWMAI